MANGEPQIVPDENLLLRHLFVSIESAEAGPISNRQFGQYLIELENAYYFAISGLDYVFPQGAHYLSRAATLINRKSPSRAWEIEDFGYTDAGSAEIKVPGVKFRVHPNHLLVITELEHHSPLKVTFRGCILLMVIAVTISGGKLRISGGENTPDVVFEAPPIAEGLRALIDLRVSDDKRREIPAMAVNAANQFQRILTERGQTPEDPDQYKGFK